MLIGTTAVSVLRILAWVAFASIIIMLTSVLLGHKDIAQMVHSKLLASILVVGINAVRSFWWNAQKLKEAL